MSTIKFLIIGDLHGEIPKLLINDFDAILAPGDIFGDDLRPYIKEWIKKRTKENNYEYDFDKICPKWMQWYLQKKSIWKGRRVLKYLNSLDKPVFVVPGNWDLSPHQDGIESMQKNQIKNIFNENLKDLKNIKNIESKSLDFKGIRIIGHGSVSAPEPLDKPFKKDFKEEKDYNQMLLRYKFYKKLYSKLESYFKQSKNLVILLSHNVPINTKLDKVNAPQTYAHNKHYGSIIARKLIDEHQPLLCVGGHIHEGYGKTRLRRTLCINAGFGGDVNTIVEIDVNKKKVVKVDFLGENKGN